MVSDFLRIAKSAISNPTSRSIPESCTSSKSCPFVEAQRSVLEMSRSARRCCKNEQSTESSSAKCKSNRTKTALSRKELRLAEKVFIRLGYYLVGGVV